MSLIKLNTCVYKLKVSYYVLFNNKTFQFYRNQSSTFLDYLFVHTNTDFEKTLHVQCKCSCIVCHVFYLTVHIHACMWIFDKS